MILVQDEEGWVLDQSTFQNLNWCLIRVLEVQSGNTVTITVEDRHWPLGSRVCHMSDESVECWLERFDWSSGENCWFICRLNYCPRDDLRHDVRTRSFWNFVNVWRLFLLRNFRHFVRYLRYDLNILIRKNRSSVMLTVHFQVIKCGKSCLSLADLFINLLKGEGRCQRPKHDQKNWFHF